MDGHYAKVAEIRERIKKENPSKNEYYIGNLVAEELRRLEKPYEHYNLRERQRELKREQRKQEEARAKLDQESILKSCNEKGECKVTIDDLKNAFPTMISILGGNVYMTQIDNKKFKEFLTNNGLTFTFPDYIFKKVN